MARAMTGGLSTAKARCMIEEKRWAAVRAQLAYTEAILNGETASAFGAYFDVYHRAVEANRESASALLFVQLRIGFIRRRLGFGALGLAQRSFLVFLSLFLLAPSTCRPRSLGSISSVIWLKCHRVPRWLITHLSALYKRVAMPSQRHLCASN